MPDKNCNHPMIVMPFVRCSLCGQKVYYDTQENKYKATLPRETLLENGEGNHGN